MDSIKSHSLQNKRFIFADAHVHLQTCFTIEAVLNSAWINFQKAALQFKNKPAFDGVLFLTETADADVYQKLQQHAAEKQSSAGLNDGKWLFSQTDEKTCIKTHRDEQETIFIVAGRQIATAEHLEVLALATKKTFKEGQPLKDVIKKIINHDGIAVIPWSVGKWVGRRGRFLEEFILQSKDSRIFLGDNSGRPKFWFKVPHFRLAKERGIRILQGTDPLPLPGEVERPGSFGFMLSGRLDGSKPATHLKQLIQNRDIDLINYGQLENFFRFFRNQFFLRIYRRT